MAWKESAQKLNVEKLVFLDESGVNIGMVRRYGRAMGGARLTDKSPVNTPKGTTLISAIRTSGVSARVRFQGGTTKEQFQKYVKETLIPTLRPGEIVIMDNVSAHHAMEVAELIEKAGASVRYLPPYSPDMNPIEKLWSKVKACLRKCRALTLCSLEKALEIAFSRVTSADCCGWFSGAGYCC